MSAAVKRKAPPTVGAVKSAGGRSHKHMHRYSTTKKKTRQFIRFAIFLAMEYVRPAIIFLLVFLMIGIIGGTERETIGMAAGMKAAFGCLCAAAVLALPEMLFFNDEGGKRR